MRIFNSYANGTIVELFVVPELFIHQEQFSRPSLCDSFYNAQNKYECLCFTLEDVPP